MFYISLILYANRIIFLEDNCICVIYNEQSVWKKIIIHKHLREDTDCRSLSSLHNIDMKQICRDLRFLMQSLFHMIKSNHKTADVGNYM